MTCQVTQLIGQLETYSQDASSLASSAGDEESSCPLNLAERQEAAASLAEELMALQAIFTAEAVEVVRFSPASPGWTPGCEIALWISAEVDDAEVRVGVTLPAFYPNSDAPGLSLLSRGVDSALSSAVSQAFESGAVGWLRGQPVLFEVIEWVRDSFASAKPPSPSPPSPELEKEERSFTGELYTSDELVDRKSIFVGYAARLTSPDEVPLVLARILKDKRVARASHPTIHAWVCTTKDGVVHRDSHDDGESAAGGRLAHLLALQELENVIVVVSRWFGGTHLGPDRFKLINRAARDALDKAGFTAKPTKKK